MTSKMESVPEARPPSPVEVAFSDQPLDLASGIDSWVASIKTKVGTKILQNLTRETDSFDRYIECAAVEEIPGAYICCSFYQREINDALTRAGLFMGAGKGLKAGTLTDQADFTLINYKKLVAGHNLPSDVLRDFFVAANAATDPGQKPNTAEASFEKHFLLSPQVRRLERFYIVGFAIQSMKSQLSVVTHEIFHASYYLNETYRELVQDFWKNDVTSEDRRLITNEIGRAYNVEVEDLVIDEFQAYLVQNHAETDRMKAFVPKYRQALVQKIADAKIKLVELS